MRVGAFPSRQRLRERTQLGHRFILGTRLAIGPLEGDVLLLDGPFLIRHDAYARTPITTTAHVLGHPQMDRTARRPPTRPQSFPRS